MSAGIRIVPRYIWLLFDIYNGDIGIKNYMWWFSSRAKARDHKKKQNAVATFAHLVGPFRYRVVSRDSVELTFHEYDCRFWRIGKSHGPCTCRKLRRKNENRRQS